MSQSEPATKTITIPQQNTFTYRELWELRKRRFYKFLKFLIPCILALILLYLGLHIFYYLRAQKMLSKIAHLPTSNQLNQTYDSLASTDIYHDYNNILSPIQTPVDLTANVPFYDSDANQVLAIATPLAPIYRTAIQKLLDHNKQYLDQFQSLTYQGPVRYAGDYNAPFSILTPHLGYINAATKLYHLRAFLYFQNNQPQLATNDILSIIQLQHSLLHEPNTMSQFVRRAIFFRHIEPLITDAILNNLFTATHLIQIQQALQADPPDPKQTFQYCLDYEYNTARQVIHNPDLLGSNRAVQYYNINTSAILWKYTYIKHIDRYHIYNLYHQLNLQLSKNDFNFTWVDKYLETTDNVSSRCIVIRGLTPIFSAIYPKHQQHLSLHNELLITIAEHRYFLDHNKYPEDNSQLIPHYLKEPPANQ
ncbi:hypothetical protein JD969_08635 [Planctomycetota bacterium]|nr:hypothetical protein JD969_08635 [Planctomycetota bacterium]